MIQNISIAEIVQKVEELIPTYMQDKADHQKSNGGIALCIIEEDGMVHGKMFGTDKNIMRERFRIAWVKASQVWITRMNTGDFEKAVFNGEVNEEQFGIKRPDFIGWEGGQSIMLGTGQMISAAFSGFTGSSDIKIVSEAISLLRESIVK